MRVVHRTKHRKAGPRTYGYYRCTGYQEHGEQGCVNRRTVSAISLEAKAWRFVREVMTDPKELTRDLDRMIELKREGERGDPQREAKTWLEELAKLERMRDGYHDQAAEGLMGLDKLRKKLADLEERRIVVNRELRAIEGREEELAQLERDRDAVLGYYAVLAPEALDSLGSEERHRLYGMLKLKVLVGQNGEAWAEMPVRPPTDLKDERDRVYHAEVTSSRSAPTAGL